MSVQRQAELQLRQGELVARSAMLRERLAIESQPLQRPFSLVDRAREGVRWLVANPQWLAAAVAIPILLRPRRVVRWVLNAWWGWGVWRRVKRLLPG